MEAETMNKLNTGAKILGACFLSGLVLCAMRVAKVINWDWFIVTAPIWGPFALLFAALSALAILTAAARVLKWLAESVKRL